MATTTFFGTGTITGEFTIDDVIVTSVLIPGELRLQKAFPYPTLETWRRVALVTTASITAWDTRGRTTVLFAHEADLGSIFYDLTGVDPSVLAGHYLYKRKASLVDADQTLARQQMAGALRELATLQVPDGHIELIKKRLESQTFNHRVAGFCAAVYLTSLLLEEDEAIT